MSPQDPERSFSVAGRFTTQFLDSNLSFIESLELSDGGYLEIVPSIPDGVMVFTRETQIRPLIDLPGLQSFTSVPFDQKTGEAIFDRYGVIFEPATRQLLRYSTLSFGGTD